MNLRDRTGEAVSVRITSSADVRNPTSTALSSAYRAEQETIVRFPIEIYIHRPRLRIVYPGQVIPSVQNQRRLSIPGHQFAAGVGKFETDRARATINGCI